MKRLFTIFVLTLLFTIHYSLFTAFASNVAVSVVSLTSAPAASAVDIKFNLTQDNTFSGTDANSASFYDRVWIFVKYWDNSWVTDGTKGWAHATLTSGGTVGAYSSATGVGVTSDGKGAFCQTGNNQTVRWHYASDGLAGTENVKVRVMAIEMVYIPQGSFYAGDPNGATGPTNCFYTHTTGGAYSITSENAINVGATSGYLYYDEDTVNDGDLGTPIPAAFPKGYKAFYIMKYEVSQGQYRDFLNTLTRTQQNTRTVSQAANQFVMSNNTAVVNRSGIRAPAVPGTGTIAFGCDLDADGTFNEANDGEWIACNFLSWADGCAYADWAGLRPMTELEFEKAARGGGSTAVAGEYAWGSATITDADTIANSGTATEGVTNSITGGLCNYDNDGVLGPLRCGFAATGTSTRAQAGAGYYGIMELSGNLWERSVTVGHSTGRSFTGTHGNGALDTSGNADNSDWPPGSTAAGAGFRGGSWPDGATFARSSDRYYAADTNAYRSSNYGGRAVRTSP